MWDRNETKRVTQKGTKKSDIEKKQKGNMGKKQRKEVKNVTQK